MQFIQRTHNGKFIYGIELRALNATMQYDFQLELQSTLTHVQFSLEFPSFHSILFNESIRIDIKIMILMTLRQSTAICDKALKKLEKIISDYMMNEDK